MKISLPSSLKKIVDSVQSPIFIVGGYIRNILGELGSSDIDLCGPLQACQLVLPKGASIRIVQQQLGTALIACDGDTYEYTPFRVEQYCGGNHTPHIVQFVNQLELDCMRRDFACNAIYYDLKQMQILDPCNGVEDCKRGLLRAVNDRVFFADGLRILRMIRLAAETGFGIDDQTWLQAKSNLHLLYDISAERKQKELNRILLADTKYAVVGGQCLGLDLACRLGILEYIAKGLVGAGTHVALKCLASTNLRVRLATFLYNVDTVQEQLTQLRYSNSTIQFVCRLIKSCKSYNDDINQNQRRVFCVQHIDIIDDIAKILGAFGNIHSATNLQSTANAIRLDGTPLRLSELKLDGNDLAKMGIVGRNIGQTLNKLWELCIATPRLNVRQKLVGIIIYQL